MIRKYDLHPTTLNTQIHTPKIYCLWRIIALRNFGSVKAGDVGGLIESEDNLSHDGLCWVGDGGCVVGVQIGGNLQVPKNSLIVGNSIFYQRHLALGSFRFATVPANKEKLLRALLTTYKQNPDRWAIQISLFIDYLRQQGVRYPEFTSIQTSIIRYIHDNS